MEYKVFACIIFYNDGVEMLKRCFESCKKYNIPIIAIDGKFKEFEGPSTSDLNHTNFCMEWFSSNPGYYIVGGEYSDQMTKRNHYLQICKEEKAEYCLVIDADEELINGNIDWEKADKDTYMVAMIDSHKTHLNAHGVRIHKITNDLEYRNRHSFLYHTDEINDPDNINSGLKRRIYRDMYIRDKENKYVTIKHYASERSAKRKEQDGIYVKNRAEYPNSGNVVYYKEEIDKTKDWPVKVRYNGVWFGPRFNGVYCDLRAGETAEVPYWHYIQLINDYSPLDWELLDDPQEVLA